MNVSVVTPEERARHARAVAKMKAKRGLRANIPTLLRWAAGLMGVLR